MCSVGPQKNEPQSMNRSYSIENRTRHVAEASNHQDCATREAFAAQRHPTGGWKGTFMKHDCDWQSSY